MHNHKLHGCLDREKFNDAKVLDYTNRINNKFARLLIVSIGYNVATSRSSSHIVKRMPNNTSMSPHSVKVIKILHTILSEQAGSI